MSSRFLSSENLLGNFSHLDYFPSSLFRWYVLPNLWLESTFGMVADDQSYSWYAFLCFNKLCKKLYVFLTITITYCKIASYPVIFKVGANFSGNFVSLSNDIAVGKIMKKVLALLKKHIGIICYESCRWFDRQNADALPESGRTAEGEIAL